VKDTAHHQCDRAPQRGVPAPREDAGRLACRPKDSALILLFGLVATGQITLRKLDGCTKQLATIIRQRMRPAA
jgi:hypothetical protein